MPGRGSSAGKEGARLSVRLDADLCAALDAWIARHPEPHPGREEAVRRLLAGALGSSRPSTVMPGLVTGRDIV
jgi:hypothetical protein